MDSFDALGSLAGDLHFEFRNLYYVLLPVFFSVAVILHFFRNPAAGPEYLESTKRAFIATLLLVGYLEICEAILFIANGISDRVSDMSGLEKFLTMAGEKASSYPMRLDALIFGANDLLLSVLSFLSYLFLYFARFFTVALYHFSWAFLTILSPLLLLFHLFSPKITLNLFKSLFEVASWQIVWSVLSAMLKALPFADAYSVEGFHITLIILNFVIALCMLGTPLLVHALVGSGYSHVAGSLGPLTATTMLALPARGSAFVSVARGILSEGSKSAASTRREGSGPPEGLFLAAGPLAPEPQDTDRLPAPPPPAARPQPFGRPEPQAPPLDYTVQGYNEPRSK